MVGEEEKPDMDELKEKAEVIAEATGRSVEAIIEDLLDDGVVNLSNEEKQTDLVAQLKEAAELITTVQSISQEVSENTVLNGGENKTDVVVETTLEGDVVDRAIESLQNKADNIKKLVITLAPIFLLLTGGSMEAFGVIDLWESESNDEYDYYENCESLWRYDDYSMADEDTIYVSFSFFDESVCDVELEGHFVVYIFREGEQSNFDAQHHNVGYFINNIDVNFEINDLEGGNYWIQYEFHDVECENGVCEHGDEWFSPHTPSFSLDLDKVGCDAYLLNEQAYILESNPEKVQISADVALVEEENNCDSEQFEIIWRLYEQNNPNIIKYEHATWEDGSISDPDGADYTTYIWDNVGEGSYEPKVILRLNGETLDEKWIAHNIVIEPQPIYGCTDENATNYDSMATDNDGSCEYPPDEPCEVEIQNHYRGHVAEDEEQDAILVAFRVVPSNCEDEMVEIDIELYQNGYDANYTHWLEVNGDNQYTDVSHTFDGVAVGDSWTPRITATLDDEQLEQVLFWGIDVVEQEPEYCEINLYDIIIGTNDTHASVGYDLDCGYETNDLDGYNVSVQFLVYNIESANNSSAQPILWDTTLCYIEGWESDNRYMTLTNFTSNNTTHYDFYWYATWTDGNGDMQMIERKWLNRELSP